MLASDVFISVHVFNKQSLSTLIHVVLNHVKSKISKFMY